MKLGPIRVFDSRKARERYVDYKHARSSDMVVPPGYIGLVELIAPEEYLPKITMTAIRIPTAATGEDSDCFKDCNIGKRYRRWKCNQTLGNHLSENLRPTKYTEYNNSIVFWGFDPFTNNIVEFEYLDRPGVYYIEANRCDNAVLDDCINPTIVEFSLIKWYPSYSPLDLPCHTGVWRPQQFEVTGTPEIIPDPPDNPPTPEPEPETVELTVYWVYGNEMDCSTMAQNIIAFSNNTSEQVLYFYYTKEVITLIKGSTYTFSKVMDYATNNRHYGAGIYDKDTESYIVQPCTNVTTISETTIKVDKDRTVFVGLTDVELNDNEPVIEI